jgi:hypothetical protein
MCPTPDGGREEDDDESVLTPDRGATGGGGSSDGSALSPDDLDIEDDEHVVSLDEGRYVIGTDERPDVPEDATGGSSGEATDGEAEGQKATGDAGGAAESAAGNGGVASGGPVNSGAVRQFLEDDLQAASARYGFHVTAKAEDAIGHQQMSSDDVGTVFDGLLRWYAQQLTTETAVEDVLGILLTESNVRVRYSPSCLQTIIEAYDLGPDDTIAELFEAVQDDRGMVFPPEDV